MIEGIPSKGSRRLASDYGSKVKFINLLSISSEHSQKSSKQKTLMLTRKSSKQIINTHIFLVLGLLTTFIYSTFDS